MDASDVFADIRLVPVVKLEDARQAVPLAEALSAAGIRAMEITLRTAAALEAIERVANAVPGMIVGAGSIRRPEQVAATQRAGARFLVSPGCTSSILEAVTDAGLPFVPGAVTPTEMMTLMDRGYRLLKFFPAELSGGVAKLKAIAAPLPEVRFFPTGGIDASLAPGYLALTQVTCIGGSWFVPEEALANGAFDQIRALAADAVALTHG
ncbi:MAG: bifunctional 4-hydroxy-2-oxoglutarate aldolase/2-dehydro-3-deoxy-phosphogluconate aldolase [Pseudomonadota bacterium]